MSIPTWAQIEDAIQLAVVTGTSITANQVRWANQGQPNTYSSANTYVTLNINNFNLGSPEYSQVTGQTNLTQTAVSPLILDIDIQIFNSVNVGINSALAIAARLANYLQLETTVDTLNLATITLDVGITNHIPVSYQTKYVDRAVISIKVNTLISTSSTAQWISDVQGDTQVNQIDGTHQHYPL